MTRAFVAGSNSDHGLQDSKQQDINPLRLGIWGAERMQKERSDGLVMDLVPGLELRPIASQADKEMSGLFLVSRREDCAPPQAGECRETLNGRSAPRDKGGIFVDEGPHA